MNYTLGGIPLRVADNNIIALSSNFTTLTTSDDNISGIGAVGTVATWVLETASYTVLRAATAVSQSWIICRKPSCWNTTRINDIIIGQ